MTYYVNEVDNHSFRLMGYLNHIQTFYTKGKLNIKVTPSFSRVTFSGFLDQRKGTKSH